MGKTEALKAVKRIVNKSAARIRFVSHSREELRKDGLTTVDVWNVLNSPDIRISEDGEDHPGGFRYRVETNKWTIVVVFHEAGTGQEALTVITCFKNNPVTSTSRRRK